MAATCTSNKNQRKDSKHTHFKMILKFSLYQNSKPMHLEHLKQQIGRIRNHFTIMTSNQNSQTEVDISTPKFSTPTYHQTK